jgi:hypothetical protein
MNDAFYRIPVPSAEEVEQRWQQSLAQFELWTQIWVKNPELAKRAGTRVEELMMPLEAVRERYTHILN